MCKVCALAGLKSTINLSIKYLVTIFLKRETDNERSTGGNEFHKRGKRWKNIWQAEDRVREEFTNLLWDELQVEEDEKEK